MSRQEAEVAFIHLKGEPYQRIVNNEHINPSRTLDALAADSNYVDSIKLRVCHAESQLDPLLMESGYYTLDAKLKHGEDLSFEEAFSLITFVCSALNRPLHAELASRIRNLGPYDTHIKQAVALLSVMSAKEAYVGLTAEEIAGMVAATVSLDTVVRVPYAQQVLSLGGMGGDRGYAINGSRSKLFSLSTLAANGLAVDGPVHKHHSYPNTSKISGQSAIEGFGARSDFHTVEAMSYVLEKCQLLMTSCHDTRTLHTISHQLRGETINHVIGPLAFTMSEETALHAFIGVNEKIHPETIVRALQILSDKGFQHYANSAVFCGTDLRALDLMTLMPDNKGVTPLLKKHIVIDEIAPPPYVTLAAFLRSGENVGTYGIYPEDFYAPRDLSIIEFAELVIPNNADQILESNRNALTGLDVSKARYLAMTIGLGLFTRYYLDRADSLCTLTRRVNAKYLRECTAYAFEVLASGKAASKLDQYVHTTNLYAGNNPNVIRRIG